MKPAQPDDGIFRRHESDDTLIVATPLAGGPWNPEHQHGGAVSGLLTRALERIDAPVPMRLTRITVEMFRGVPLGELRLETRVLRAGRRIQSVEAGLFDDAVQVARATGLRIRREPQLAEHATPTQPDPTLGMPPDPVPEIDFPEDFEGVPGFIGAVDMQPARATANGEPAHLWTRLRCRLMEGEQTSPIVQLATLVDFASGTGNAVDYMKYTSINPDLTIHVLREPRSDWIGIRGVTLWGDDGTGQTTASVQDLEGPVAQVQASLLLDRR